MPCSPARWLRRALPPLLALALIAAKPAPNPAPPVNEANPPDPFLWLESVNSPRAMAWVQAQNAATFRRLGADPNFKQFRETALYLAQSGARIPLPATLHGTITNFWQDAAHVQGIWRATTPASYATKSPAWRTLIDLDALSAAEHHHWVWKGATCAAPEDRLCLVALSEGGEDKVTLREFNTKTARFVPDGFTIPRAKTVADWLSPDVILVATDWGPASMTQSGYPFVLKRLRRGQPLTAAWPLPDPARFSGSPLERSLALTVAT
jgi:prolyl oligopeptidase